MKALKVYEEPKLTIVQLSTDDIICTSGCAGKGGNDTQDDCLMGE